MKEILHKAKLIICHQFLLLCYQMTAGGIDRVLWWTDQEFSPVIIIPPLFCMLIYYLGDE
jgi:hypothetical protein